MKVVSLNEKWEPQLLNYINEHFPDNYNFVKVFKRNPRDIQVYIVTDEKKCLLGYSSIYYHKFAYLGGTKEAIEALIPKLSNNIFLFNTPAIYKEVILQKYNNIEKTGEDMVMLLTTSDYIPFETSKPVELKEMQREDILRLMKAADPEEWKDITLEEIPFNKNWIWLGIFFNKKLISVGGGNVSDRFGAISYLATDSNYRNRGYATSIISYLANYLLSKVPLVLVMRRANNAISKQVYQKIGFKPFRTYFWIKPKK